MAKKGKSDKPVTTEWAKHLRKFEKRKVSKRERRAANRETKRFDKIKL